MKKITLNFTLNGDPTSVEIDENARLLDKNPHPTREEIKIAISGNLCRCTGYQQLVDAFEEAAEHYQRDV